MSKTKGPQRLPPTILYKPYNGDSKQGTPKSSYVPRSPRPSRKRLLPFWGNFGTDQFHAILSESFLMSPHGFLNSRQ